MVLFNKIKSPLHGGDYNPEQWLLYPEILKEDLRLMKLAKVNAVSLGIFAWSVYEPTEGNFNFEWLDKIINELYENGIFTILATPTGARPAWLDEKYEEVLRVNSLGVRNYHGLRHNHCMSSPIFRQKVEIINTLLAKRYGGHPAVILWHISNELGGECYCELCQNRFREFLRAKYKNDIELLNHEWWTTFWSHGFNDFDQIEAPSKRGESTIHGLNLDWRRFNTWNMTDYLKFEINTLRKITSKIPVTTNFMRLYNGFDYNEMAKELDLISWDSYPAWGQDSISDSVTAAESSFDHCVMRSLKKDKPFLLMESVPSQVNWHPFNKLKRPGIHKLSAIQAIACGSDSVLYFQWRKSRGSFEQHHGAVVDHTGSSETRVFKEVAVVGRILENIQEITGSIVKAKVAVIFDWNNRWAIEDIAGLSKQKRYEETCREIYGILLQNGIEADILSSEEELLGYKAVIAPMLYLLKPKTSENLKKFVQKGGTLISTYLMGYVNENTLCYLGGFPGDGLAEVFGLYAEEIDVYYPNDKNSAVFTNSISGTFEISDFCEIIKPTTAKTLAVYGSDFYKGNSVVTVNQCDSGLAYYIGARIEKAGMESIIRHAFEKAGLSFNHQKNIEYHIRENNDYLYHFYLNWTDKPQEIKTKPEFELLSGFELFNGDENSATVKKVKPINAVIYREKK